MNTQAIEDVANAVLYEGYILYPYRPSSIKNRQRWNFGVLYPRAYAEAQSGADLWSMRTECLVQARAGCKVSVRVRFLHLWEGSAAATERDIRLAPLDMPQAALDAPFSFPAEGRQQQVEGLIQVHAERLDGDLLKIRVEIFNTSPFDGLNRDAALMRALVSTHTILGVEHGEFVSLLEPPDRLRDLAAGCQNVGTWPVLAGDEPERDAMLSSPIILYDYPKIAPESPGDLFDGTEIDEILALRILTLTDQEKAEMGLSCERAREVLARTETMGPEDFMKLHGVMRGPK